MYFSQSGAFRKYAPSYIILPYIIIASFKGEKNNIFPKITKDWRYKAL